MSEIETRELICIGCPLGCLLTVEMKGTEVVSVTGNTLSLIHISEPTRPY